MKIHRKYRTRYTPGGSIIARRIGVDFLHQSEIYHALITMSWFKFFIWLGIGYLSMAFVFGFAYIFADVENMKGLTSGESMEQFWQVFLYSAQTLSTIGGAGITPVGLVNNVIFTAESIIALLGAAVITGLLYVRFSRPSARMVYSNNALIAPFKEGKALMLRLGNAKKNELLELTAQVIFIQYNDLTTRRTFIELGLERQKIPYIPVTWTIVHPINEKSPFFNMDESTLHKKEFDIMVTIIALDGITGQNVFSAHSYSDLDLVWNAKFRSCSEVDEQGMTLVYLDKIGEYEKLEQR